MSHAVRKTNIAALADELCQRDTGGRLIIAIAGPPGAGKSHAAKRLREALEARNRRAAVFPMDGFHYDDAVLGPRGLLPRKGAPETFDISGFAHMLTRLRRNDEDAVAVPVFDRDLEIARAGARLIPRAVEFLITEGNYLLLDRPGWSALPALFDVTVMIRADEALLRKRLSARWVGQGLDQDEITAKVEANDLPNGRLVAANSIAPDYVIISTDEQNERD